MHTLWASTVKNPLFMFFQTAFFFQNLSLVPASHSKYSQPPDFIYIQTHCLFIVHKTGSSCEGIWFGRRKEPEGRDLGPLSIQLITHCFFNAGNLSPLVPTSYWPRSPETQQWRKANVCFQFCRCLRNMEQSMDPEFGNTPSVRFFPCKFDSGFDCRLKVVPTSFHEK